jgi:hypothetical protein
VHTEITNKWGKAITDAGFQQVPDVLIRAQSILGIDCVSMAILLNLTMHWWEKDNLPWPRPSVIANRIGVSTRTVERKITEMTDQGLIERLPPEKTEKITVRRFDLSGLLKKLEPLAEIYCDNHLQKKSAKQLDVVGCVGESK